MFWSFGPTHTPVPHFPFKAYTALLKDLTYFRKIGVPACGHAHSSRSLLVHASIQINVNRWVLWILNNTSFASWWFQPNWEILVKLASRGENKKSLKPPTSMSYTVSTLYSTWVSCQLKIARPLVYMYMLEVLTHITNTSPFRQRKNTLFERVNWPFLETQYWVVLIMSSGVSEVLSKKLFIKLVTLNHRVHIHMWPPLLNDILFKKSSFHDFQFQYESFTTLKLTYINHYFQFYTVSG